jgi:hypothetical protein
MRPSRIKIRRRFDSPRNGVALSDDSIPLEVESILIRDPGAARRWLVSVIAGRVVSIHRERQKALEKKAGKPDRDDHGHAYATADGDRQEQQR